MQKRARFLRALLWELPLSVLSFFPTVLPFPSAPFFLFQPCKSQDPYPGGQGTPHIVGGLFFLPFLSSLWRDPAAFARPPETAVTSASVPVEAARAAAGFH